jgi:hypothetical protein
VGLGEFRERLQGPEGVIIIEAAAGAGKTHEAVEAAQRTGEKLPRGRSPLLLTHTTAARDEFTKRFGSNRRAHVQTLDSLACELVDRYALHFRLPRPLRPGATHAGHPDFPEIRRVACELLREAPPVAQGMAFRHPVILVDEHQDSSDHQHEMVWRIAQAGARLRLFGDRLQAIYDWTESSGPWMRLVEEHTVLSLTQPRRWPDTPELGEWLLAARSALLAGQPVSVSGDVRGLTVSSWQGSGPKPKQAGSCPESLRDCLGAIPRIGRTAVLVYGNSHAYGLVVRMGQALNLRLHEGSDLRAPTRWLEAAIGATGDPVALIGKLADVLEQSGTGLDAKRRAELEAVCTADGVDLGRRTRIATLAGYCEPLYTEPTLTRWLEVLRRCLVDHKDLDWRPVQRGPLHLLYVLRVGPDADPLDALSELARLRRGKNYTPKRAAMTVHRAKGQEFHTVVIPYVGESSFDVSTKSARRLYVAMTRAQCRLHLLIPTDEPSPLVAWN